MLGPKAVSHLSAQPGMTKQVMMNLIRKVSRLKDIPRNKPPVKGAFISYLEEKGMDKLLS